MPDNPQNFPSHAGGPPSCPCQCRVCRQPQLNPTVTGRYSGCGTCLCANDDGGSSRDSARITQPSSGMDDLQHSVAVNLNIDGAVKCCHCCEQRPEHLIRNVVDAPKPQSAPASVASRARRCGPWAQRANGDFILRDQEWESSTDGRFSYRFSLELRYNNTRAPSVATQPATGGLISPHSCPVVNADGEGHSPGEIQCQAGEWMDAAFKNKHYLCACPSRVGSPSAGLDVLMGDRKMHSAYPETIHDEDCE